MVVAIRFNIKPTNSRCVQLDGSIGPAAAALGAGTQGAGTAGVVPTPTRLSYAPNPRTYIYTWLTETVGTGVAELAKECDFYHDAFTGNLVEHVTIITSLLATSNSVVFLAVLAGDQVCTVHLIGRFIWGISKLTPSNNHILYWG